MLRLLVKKHKPTNNIVGAALDTTYLPRFLPYIPRYLCRFDFFKNNRKQPSKEKPADARIVPKVKLVLTLDRTSDWRDERDQE